MASVMDNLVIQSNRTHRKSSKNSPVSLARFSGPKVDIQSQLHVYKTAMNGRIWTFYKMPLPNKEYQEIGTNVTKGVTEPHTEKYQMLVRETKRPE